MDNVTHTLVGAALARAGLDRRTGLGYATLLIGANLPDVDVAGALVGENLAFRRGWTHGPLALVLLPALLALKMLAYDRWQGRRGRRPAARAPVRGRELLLLAFVGVASHPLLDLLNTYGVRCLMPFSERWFYGDTLFIIDLWIWLGLGGGLWLARRRRRRGDPGAVRPVRAALAATTLYTLAMAGAGLAAERHAAREAVARGLGTPRQVVASPVPVDPLRRAIVIDLGGRYARGELRFAPGPRLALAPELVETRMDDPAIARAAARDRRVADFLYWSRLPFAEIERVPGEARVTLGDARYNRSPGDGPFTVRSALPE